MLKAHDFRVTLVPLFQDKSSSKTFQMKMSLVCIGRTLSSSLSILSRSSRFGSRGPWRKVGPRQKPEN